MFNHTFVHCLYVNFVNICHFYVNLCKFRLTVSTEVFVAEAACNLNISVVAGKHKQLFVNLWRLWQSKEFARLHTGWNNVVTCAFRCGFHKHRCFDFDKVVFVIIVTNCTHNFVTNDKAIVHFASSQIEITVFKFKFVLNIDIIFDFKRCCFCFGENLELVNLHFDFACRNVRVCFFSEHNCTFCHNNKFCTEHFCFFQSLFITIVAKVELYNAFCVANIAEHNCTKVSNFCNVTCYCHFFANIGFAQSNGVVGSSQITHCFHKIILLFDVICFLLLKFTMAKPLLHLYIIISS